jgi:hypothetical protein
VLELDAVSKMLAAHNELVTLPLDIGDQVANILSFTCLPVQKYKHWQILHLLTSTKVQILA